MHPYVHHEKILPNLDHIRIIVDTSASIMMKQRVICPDGWPSLLREKKWLLVEVPDRIIIISTGDCPGDMTVIVSSVFVDAVLMVGNLSLRDASGLSDRDSLTKELFCLEWPLISPMLVESHAGVGVVNSEKFRLAAFI